MKITQLTPSYLPQAASLFNQYRIFYGKESDIKNAAKFLEERLRNQESIVFLCVDEADIACGFMQLYPSFSSVSLARIFILNDLYVDEKYCKKGIGKMLLEAAKDYAKKNNAARLTLSTAKTNKIARQLYEDNGYKLDEEYFSYNLVL